MVIFTDALRKLSKVFKTNSKGASRKSRMNNTDWKIVFVESVKGIRLENTYEQKGTAVTYTDPRGGVLVAKSSPMKYDPHSFMWFLKNNRHPTAITMELIYNKETQ